MSYEDEIETLRLFNKKIEKILSYSYFNKKQSLTISARKNEPVKIESQMPTDEQLDSIILTTRLFMQDNDKISIRNLSKIYDNLPISQDYKDRFIGVRNKLNSFLENKIEYRYNNREWTRRELLESIIYGEKAHLSDSKKENLQIWKRDEISEEFTKMLFNDIILRIVEICNSIHLLNKKVVESLEV